MTRNLKLGPILGFLIMYATLLAGCGSKEVQQIPVVVEQKTPTIFKQQTPFPDPPNFEGSTSYDLWMYTKALEDKLEECNKAKAKMQ